MNFIKKYIFVISGIAVGLAGGFLYWKFVGCTTGSCPLKSNVMIMTAYGGFAGAVFGNIAGSFRKKK